MTDQQILDRWGPVVADFESKSKPGTRYRVRQFQATGLYSCNCSGWRFRKNCRHVQECQRQKLGPCDAEWAQLEPMPTVADPLAQLIENALLLNSQNQGRFKSRPEFARELAAKIRDSGLAAPAKPAFEAKPGKIRLIYLED